LDFFIDEKYHTSPFLELYETVPLKQTQTQKRIHQQNNTIKTTFQNTTQILSVKNKSSQPEPEPLTIKNRFLYQGKIINFSFCQKILKPRNRIKSTIYNEIFENNPQMSYRDFKKTINQTKSTL
jgi:hypothetical protein